MILVWPQILVKKEAFAWATGQNSWMGNEKRVVIKNLKQMYR